MPAGPRECLVRPSSTSFKRRSKSLVSRARTKVSTTAAIVPASPGVITPPASAEVTAFIAAAMSWAFSPRALSRGSALDRRQREFYRAIAARRQDAFEAQPHRSRIADERQVHRLL